MTEKEKEKGVTEIENIEIEEIEIEVIEIEVIEKEAEKEDICIWIEVSLN